MRYPIEVAYVAFASLYALPAVAQGPASSSAGGLEEIIVTAQRRSENLQSVPIAVTALTAKDLDKAGATAARDLSMSVAGLNIQVENQDTQIKIRGIGSEDPGLGSDPSVAVYIDGVYQPISKGDAFNFNDIERIEVLKGPQGTLFGRNATGGLINFITRSPSFTETNGALNFSYSRFNTMNVNAFISGPLAPTLAAHIGGYYTRSDGFLKDPNQPGVHVAKNKAYAVRAKFRWQPADNLSFALALDTSYSNDPAPFMPTIVDHSSTLDALGTNTPPNIISSKPYESTVGTTPTNTVRTYGASLISTINFDGVDLISVSGFQRFKNVEFIPHAESTPFGLVQFEAVPLAKTYSEDLRLQSSEATARFRWTAGFNAYHRTQAWNDYNVTLLPLVTGAPVPLLFQSFVPQASSAAFAVYGQASYDLTDRFIVIMGARYSTETVKDSVVSAQSGVISSFPTQRGKAKFHDFSPKVTLQYKFTDKTMVYASYGKGFKSGILNPLQVTAVAPDGTPTPEEATKPIQPEKITAWEIGLKSDFLDRFRANISAFYYDYKNLQVELVAPGGNGNLIENAAQATVKGVDGDFNAVFPDMFSDTDRLSLTSALAYLDAKYDSYPSAATYFYPGPGQGLILGASDAKGKRLTRAPKWTASLTADYSMETDIGRFNLVGLVYRTSKFFYDAANSPRFGHPAYTQINLSFGWESTDRHVRASVWGKNITDTRTFQQTYLLTFGELKRYYAPATYGVTLGYTF